MDALKRYREIEEAIKVMENEQRNLKEQIVDDLFPFKAGDTISNGKIIAKIIQVGMHEIDASGWPVFYANAIPLKADGKPRKKEIAIIPEHLSEWEKMEDLFEWDQTR